MRTVRIHSLLALSALLSLSFISCKKSGGNDPNPSDTTNPTASACLPTRQTALPGNTVVYTYQYDPATRRLVGFTDLVYVSGQGDRQRQTTINYFDNGNRIVFTQAAVGSSPQLITTYIKQDGKLKYQLGGYLGASDTTHYLYDSQGRLTQISSPYETKRISYNAQNLPETITDSSSGLVQVSRYTYDLTKPVAYEPNHPCRIAPGLDLVPIGYAISRIEESRNGGPVDQSYRYEIPGAGYDSQHKTITRLVETPSGEFYNTANTYSYDYNCN